MFKADCQENLENDEAAAREIWDPLLQYLFSQPWFHRRKQMDHMFIFADGQSARVWDSYDLVRSEAIFMMVEPPAHEPFVCFKRTFLLQFQLLNVAQVSFAALNNGEQNAVAVILLLKSSNGKVEMSHLGRTYEEIQRHQVM